MNVPSVTLNHESRRGASGDRSTLWKSLIVVLPLLALPALWRWTPLNQWINFATIVDWQDSVRSNPAAPYWIVGGYVLASLVFFPVTLLSLATVFTFGPIWGNAYGLAGWLLSAGMGYGMGRAFGQDRMRKTASASVERFLEQAGRHGFLAVLAVRILPVAPFTLVNLFIGAAGIRFRQFFCATLLGRLPGIVTLTLFGFQIENMLRKPVFGSLILLALALVLALMAAIWLLKYFGSQGRRG